MCHSIIELRGHHLLCILTYMGKGYTPAFVENYDAIVAQINRGDVTLKIVSVRHTSEKDGLHTEV
jgi:hypothetical protein